MNDSRTEEEKNRDSRLARDYLDVTNAQIEQLKRSATNIETPKFEYPVQIHFESVLFTMVTVTFYKEIIHGKAPFVDLTALGGGVALGVGIAWGTAWLNVDAGTLPHQKGAIQFNLTPVAMNVQLWANDTFIGSAVAGGIAVVGGIGGAGGVWQNVKLQSEKLKNTNVV